jgi:site-specific DNA-adenine methylase
MSLDELSESVQDNYAELDEELAVTTDRETRNELAMLEAALDPEDTDELLRRAVHMLFQSTVETGTLDFHLRTEYDVTYDEYLSGMTFDEMTGADLFPNQGDPDDRRYQF